MQNLNSYKTLDMESFSGVVPPRAGENLPQDSAENKMNPDLKKERSMSKIDVDRLTRFVGKQLFGTIEKFERMNVLRKKIVSEIKPLLQENYENLTRGEKYELNMKKSLEMIEFGKENKVTDNMEYTYLIGSVLGSEKQVFGLHFSMFAISLDLWSTPEQRAYWKSFMEKNVIFGTYIQTEIGHGTFVRGLETTATYDKSTQEFILNSPTLTSIKFWPGSSGKSCNFAVVMAELIIEGKKHGIHAFVVQLRSLNDHSPMKGIELGDIGKKNGYDPIDNGFVAFRNYRIPRFNMLMRFTQVTPEGEFKRVGSEQIMYACMLIMRNVMCMFAALLLSISTTITVRYSCVRRQTPSANGDESQIIDYQTQQSRILPGLATTYALLFVSLKFRNILYSSQSKTDFFKTIQAVDLARLHAVSCGLKSVVMEETLKFAQLNRLCCGGHGYSSSSGLPAIIQEADAGCTYEGDNVVLLLQTARYLLKCAQKNTSPHLTPPNLDQIRSSRFFNRFEPYINLYERLYDSLLAKVSDQMTRFITDEGLTDYEAWNRSSVVLTQLSRSYVYLFINNAFLSYLSCHERENCSANQEALIELFELYLLYGIVETNAGWFLKLDLVAGEQMSIYENRYFELLATVRKDAVCLVDAFNWSDSNLGSTLGVYDGNVYEKLFEFAQNSQLNAKSFDFGFWQRYTKSKL